MNIIYEGIEVRKSWSECISKGPVYICNEAVSCYYFLGLKKKEKKGGGAHSSISYTLTYQLKLHNVTFVFSKKKIWTLLIIVWHLPLGKRVTKKKE